MWMTCEAVCSLNRCKALQLPEGEPKRLSWTLGPVDFCPLFAFDRIMSALSSEQTPSDELWVSPHLSHKMPLGTSAFPSDNKINEWNIRGLNDMMCRIHYGTCCVSVDSKSCPFVLLSSTDLLNETGAFCKSLTSLPLDFNSFATL